MPRALIVSTDANASYLYRVAIGFQDIKVQTVKTIAEAVKKAQKSLPDLMILDLDTIDFAEMTLFNPLKKAKKMPVIILVELENQAAAKKQAAVFNTYNVLPKKESYLGELIRTVRERIHR